MRNTKTVIIQAEGRDFGKSYILTELSAMKAEKWAARALLALLKSGLQVPDEIAQAGLGGVAALGMNAFANLSFESAEPLLDEMMTCVQFVSSSGSVRPLSEAASDIEEVKTLWILRQEVLELHLGFSIADKLST